MKKRIAGVVIATALVAPLQVGASASAAAAPMLGSSEVGCNINCPPVLGVVLDLLGALSSGSSGGGGAPAA
ncbi:hypothetical protein B0T44_10700 [Nocardia donostiensis]|uniref:Secreted protein n=1 Tax=Nocardia donostiensis TaxID=1538463 RepID=A0A1W0AUI8_9NOCA|nr:hypothetical protein B0T46_14045 [Nocardia donostiensis]OQS13893.1 hypothetical protein B0T36_17340 [Nocardia donostiensis]OQS20348.1 hypothetical protein B0T44_10700 [Nocardia donostiensis]